MLQFTVNIDLGIREIRQITTFIRDTHGVDYSEYALTSFKRRLEGFMSSNKYSIDTLMTKLESKEFLDHFIACISVPSTELFRDPTFWLLLKNNYISDMLKENRKPKIWLPLCASGEEYYSLAILLKESNWNNLVDVYVSSDSNETLELIKSGYVDYEKLEISSKNYTRFQGISQFTDYYTVIDRSANFDKSLFANTTFYHEDLNFSRDFGHINMILFRNKLIYFTNALQYKVCDAMYNKLAVKGILALGILEEIDLTTNGKFVALNKQESIYQRKG